MATYKVLQDIEAEDKLVGPLSLRQFLYAAVTIVLGFITFKLISVSVFFIFPFAPFIILFGVLAAPFGRDQPSEIWLLAKIRFALKPHKRIWNQDGAINLVTVTAPKTLDKQLTKNLTPNEVNSRLKALANTIDSRGWAIKNINVNLGTQPQPVYGGYGSSQRLIDPSSLPQDVPTVSVSAADDILDPNSNPTAQHFEQMIKSSDQARRKKIMESVTHPQPIAPPRSYPDSTDNNAPLDYWFLNDITSPEDIPKGYANFVAGNVIQPGDDESLYAGAEQTTYDTSLLNKINQYKEELEEEHMRDPHYISPTGKKGRPKVDISEAKAPKISSKPDKTPPSNPDIINLALANKDNWSVATAQHEAEKARKKQEQSPDEVVINLH